MSKILILSFVIPFILCPLIVNSLKSNATQLPQITRQKRDLLFRRGPNICKSVLGVSFPVDLRDKVNFRTLNLAYNFQAQYMLVPSTTHPWTIFKRSLYNQKVQSSENKTCCTDDTRKLFYNAFEVFALRKGINGKECLLRAICENSQSPVKVTGIFDELLNLFLNPNENDVEKCYIDAKKAGALGVDCLTLYKECPMGHGFLDAFFTFMH